jgi:ribonucleoside-diphosphate reductase alpha chain
MTTFKLDGYGKEIFNLKYAYPGEKTWLDRSKVIARTIASAELDSDKTTWEKKFREILDPADFIPGGRIIYGAGRNANQQNLLNCFGLSPEDTVDSLGVSINDMYVISCAGGGIGFNMGEVRPKGDNIQNLSFSAPGTISNMRMYNEIGSHVKAGGNRRVALLAMLPVTHPDILEYLDVKLNKGELTNFNISVGITNRFIEACERDEDWYFTFNNKPYDRYEITYRNGDKIRKVFITATSKEDAIGRATAHGKEAYNEVVEDARKSPIKAMELWEFIWGNSLKSGDPGILNLDKMTNYTNVSYFEKLVTTNPCGELPLPAHGNCCLGHINLSNMVLDDGSDVDWKRLARTVRRGVRFLDNVLTINSFPTKSTKDAGERSRRIGLGVTGLHYMLIKLGLRYGSDKSLEFVERLFETIKNEAYITSSYLARDKSPFPAFNRKDYLEQEFAKTLPARVRMMIKQYGIRNAVILTVAPVGTTSIVFGVSTGLEPIFAPIYIRRHKVDGVVKETVLMDKLFEQYIREGKDTSHFVGAYDVTPEQHMKMQVAIQSKVDNSTSKTINFPKDFDDPMFAETALEYVKELKGLTIYRAGSKGDEPLQAIPTTKENIAKYLGVEVGSNSGDACSLTGGGC